MNKKALIMPIVAICVSAVLLFAVSAGTKATAQANYEKELNELMLALLPGSTSFTEEAYDGEDANIKAVYRDDKGGDARGC